MYSYWAARLHFLHQEDKGEHDEHGYAEEPEVVYVRQHGGLSIEHICDHGVGLVRSLIGGRSFGYKRARSLSNYGLELWTSRMYVVIQIGLMELSPPREHCGDE